jgi:hypothetical protein
MTPHRIPPLVLTLALATLALGCTERVEQRLANPLEAPPVDTSKVRSALVAAGWDHRQAVDIDLDGDTVAERLVLASDVTVRPDGTPLWEDGHRWAVFVETPTGERTMLYAAFVPHGFAEVGILAPDDRGRRHVLVQERSPNQLRTFDVEYEGTGKARGQASAQWALEAWLQDLPQAP